MLRNSNDDIKERVDRFGVSLSAWIYQRDIFELHDKNTNIEG